MSQAVEGMRWGGKLAPLAAILQHQDAGEASGFRGQSQFKDSVDCSYKFKHCIIAFLVIVSHA